MRPSKGIAFAVAGVAVGLFGLSMSILGLIIAQQGTTSIGPMGVFGSLVAGVGVFIALLAVSAIKE